VTSGNPRTLSSAHRRPGSYLPGRVARFCAESRSARDGMFRRPGDSSEELFIFLRGGKARLLMRSPAREPGCGTTHFVERARFLLVEGDAPSTCPRKPC